MSTKSLQQTIVSKLPESVRKPRRARAKLLKERLEAIDARLSRVGVGTRPVKEALGAMKEAYLANPTPENLKAYEQAVLDPEVLVKRNAELRHTHKGEMRHVVREQVEEVRQITAEALPYGIAWRDEVEKPERAACAALGIEFEGSAASKALQSQVEALRGLAELPDHQVLSGQQIDHVFAAL